MPVQLQAAQSFDGVTFTDLTRFQRDGLPLALGHESHPPQRELACSLSRLPQPLAPNQPLSLWLRFQTAADRDAILTEAQEQAKLCQRSISKSIALPTPPANDPWCLKRATLRRLPRPIPHRPAAPSQLRTVWEISTARTAALADNAIADETRSFTLEGAVQIRFRHDRRFGAGLGFRSCLLSARRC
jgi:hypothetical protein